MPELPEVETTRRGIQPKTEKAVIQSLVVRNGRLRWPVPEGLNACLTGLKIESVTRRAKYLLLKTAKGTLIIHLGMSGNLRILPHDTPPKTHDHIDLCLTNGYLLRYHDPRRFGAWLWTEKPIEQHPLIQNLAPEPLSEAFDADWLASKLSKRKSPIKSLIMNNAIAVGVGNIYANESLFLSRIHPTTLGNQLSREQIETLVSEIKSVLTQAIAQGGTTLKDFLTPDGSPGYFEQSLFIYGRAGENCLQCGHPIEKIILGQRASFFCPNCQPAPKS